MSPSTRMIFYSLFSLLFVFEVATALSCLVIRPGYGLVSEQCPASAVGCRIRVAGDHIEWYEWARLYDRNQLVCVYPEEYTTLTGCQRKASGSIRCWCGGMDDCNDAPTSKGLYESFTGKDTKKFERILKRLESGVSNEIGEEDVAEATTTRATTTTPVKTTHKKLHVKKVTIITRAPPTTTTTTKPTTAKPTTTLEPTYLLPTVATRRQHVVSVRKHPTSTVVKTVDPAARPLPTEVNMAIDETFAETRRKLEAEMKEEDERLEQLLRDEESELDDETEEEEEKKAYTQRNKQQGSIERRERARADERRRQAEEERLARMERDEAAEKEKERVKQLKTDKKNGDDEYEYDGFGFTASSTTNFNILISFIALMFQRLL